jgi:hypothetical protein
MAWPVNSRRITVDSGWLPLRSKKMKIARNQGPGKTAGLCIGQDIAESFEKSVTVDIVLEYLFTLDSSYDHMM